MLDEDARAARLRRAPLLWLQPRSNGKIRVVYGPQLLSQLGEHTPERVSLIRKVADSIPS